MVWRLLCVESDHFESHQAGKGKGKGSVCLSLSEDAAFLMSLYS
jgi:hypothetical protein